MSPRATLSVSTAAEKLHPGLTTALNGVGANLLNRMSVAVVVAGETASSDAFVVERSRTIGRAICSRTGASVLSFEASNISFAASLIVAMARGDATPTAVDPASVELSAMASRVGARDVTVLIGGPTGTGKEVLARYIHSTSPRHAAPLVAVNCAALPESMLEAMLFGHERGAFTGAGASSKGLFRAADGGTLLLDEIAELPLGLQAKLLRVLQEREVLPIGATVPQPIDVRIVAAANRDLAAEVAAGRFRADLYYRLAVFPLAITALADRRADIVPIAAALWLRQGATAWPTAAALAKLEAYHWPGNVRELGNVIARATVFADGERIEAGDIVFDSGPRTDSLASLGGFVREREFAVIRSTLADCSGRRGETATRLGISERTLRYKLAAMSAVPRAAGSAMTLQ